MGKKRENTMDTDTENAKRLAKIDKKLADKHLKKKARRALQAEREALVAAVAKKPKKDKAEKFPKNPPANKYEATPIGEDPEVKAAHAAAVKVLRKHGHPGQPGPDDIDRAIPELVDAYNLVIGKLTGHYITSDAEKAKTKAQLDETDAEIKARIEKKREARAVAPDVEHDATVTPIDVKKKLTKADAKLVAKVEAAQAEAPALVAKASKKKGKVEDDAGLLAELVAAAAEKEGTPDGTETGVEISKTLADPAPQQPRDRWDRPLILPPDAGADDKPVGYKRVTTFIDVVDDKTALTNWGRRIVMAGVAAIEQKIEGETELAGLEEVGSVSVIERVKEANRQLAKTAQKADKDLAKGKLDDTAHATVHDAAEEAHKAALDELVQEAFRAGDGFTKAETGTRIHKLTEIWDTEGHAGLVALGDVTKSEWRDLEAYAAACASLNVEVQAVEQFVVIDEFQTAGTLDRRLRYDSPKLDRRITAIGDVKTGRVDFGSGKMTRQLAAYAMGKGYDWQTNERTTFRTNREVGLIFHLPAGQGVCTVYEIDLKKGLEGLKLCAAIYAHRSETTTAKVFDKIATGVPEGQAIS